MIPILLHAKPAALPQVGIAPKKLPPKEGQPKAKATAKERSLYGTGLPPSTGPGGPRSIKEQFTWPTRLPSTKKIL